MPVLNLGMDMELAYNMAYKEGEAGYIPYIDLVHDNAVVKRFISLDQAAVKLGKTVPEILKLFEKKLPFMFYGGNATVSLDDCKKAEKGYFIEIREKYKDCFNIGYKYGTIFNTKNKTVSRYYNEFLVLEECTEEKDLSRTGKIIFDCLMFQRIENKQNEIHMPV